MCSWSLLPACASGSSSAEGQSPNALATDDEKILYTLGRILGENIANAALTEAELSTVLTGLTDSALGRESQVDLDQYGPMLQVFMQQRIENAAGEELTRSMAFVDEQAGLTGATRTESGIVIQELEAGNGQSPTVTDTVRVHYHGTLQDGSVFDSSVDRGEPASFPLNGVIPCWTEGVQTMQVGGKSRLVCPPDLAYGPAGRPGIPGNAALVFEVELLEILGN
jgi:FKBP-type peptidyl-prolyl cis-trans isomerase